MTDRSETVERRAQLAEHALRGESFVGMCFKCAAEVWSVPHTGATFVTIVHDPNGTHAVVWTGAHTAVR